MRQLCGQVGPPNLSLHRPLTEQRCLPLRFSRLLRCRSKHLGVTGPISNAAPTAQDLELTEQLKATLHEHKMFDTEEGIEHRLAH